MNQKQSFAIASNGSDTLCFLPSVLDVRVMQCKHARLNGAGHAQHCTSASGVMLRVIKPHQCVSLNPRHDVKPGNLVIQSAFVVGGKETE